jgi:hypothetical protein
LVTMDEGEILDLAERWGTNLRRRSLQSELCPKTDG